MIVGYARVSTKEQSLDIQIDELTKLGCEKIFSDKLSGGSLNRKGLDDMIGYVRDGDTVICMKTDRIARDTMDALFIADTLKGKGCGLKLMDLGDQDINSTMGRVVYTIISALAQAEKERIKERCEAGREKAREKGIHLGRKSTVDRNRVIELKERGLGPAAISREMNISLSSANKILANHKKNHLKIV